MGTKIATNQKGVVVCSFLLDKALEPICVCILVPTPLVAFPQNISKMDISQKILWNNPKRF